MSYESYEWFRTCYSEAAAEKDNARAYKWLKASELLSEEHEKNIQLSKTNTELILALEVAHQAIYNMKNVVEIAAQGDKQWLLDAIEVISNVGLIADTAIRATITKHKGEEDTP